MKVKYFIIILIKMILYHIFNEDTLYDMLEKIYNEIYINDLYRNTLNLKINLRIFDLLSETEFNVGKDILKFK